MAPLTAVLRSSPELRPSGTSRSPSIPTGAFKYRAGRTGRFMPGLTSISILSEPQLAGDVDGNGISDLIASANGTWTVSSPVNSSILPQSSWLQGFGDGSQ